MLVEQEVVVAFRSDCPGLQVDFARWEGNVHLEQVDRLCLACNFAQAVRMISMLSLIVQYIVPSEQRMQICFIEAYTVAHVLSEGESYACDALIRNCFSPWSHILPD